jgi:rhodanese-related sulfurtransferase
VNRQSRFIVGGIFVLCILLAVIIFLERRPVADRNDISPDTLQARVQQGDTTLLLLDVRTPQEFKSDTGHLQGAILIPVQELKNRMAELNPYKSKTIIAYCRTGHRSSLATDMLRGEGFTVMNLTGGITLWNEKMLPVTRKDGQ